MDEYYSVDSHGDIVQTTQGERRKSAINREILREDETNLFLRKNNPSLYTKFSKKNFIAIILYIIGSIITGTLIVCFTTRKTEFICDRHHEPTITRWNKSDSRPESLALAQLNNDQYFDFVVVNKALNTFDIYLGTINRTFEYHRTYSTGSDSFPSSVVAANFDHQNGVDIAIANYGSNSIGIYLGFNNGNFIEGKSFSTGSSRPIFIATNDLNNDDQLDLVVVNGGTQSIGIYLGLGDGSFRLLNIYSTGFDSFPNCLSIADLDRDHRLDIVVANSGTNNFGLFRGYGNGTFEEQIIYSTGFQSNPLSIAIDDVNNDLYLDIVVANSGTNNIKIYFGDEKGNFNGEISFSTGSNSHPSFVGIGDVNGDEQLDLIVLDSINERIDVLPGKGNGSFPRQSTYDADVGSNPVFFACSDLNEDNRSEIVVVDRGSNDVLLLGEYQMKYFLRVLPLIEEVEITPVSFASGDMDGDDILDLISVSNGDRPIWMLRGYGNGSFQRYKKLHTGDPGFIGIALGDLNNDHRMDIAVVSFINQYLGILFGYGNGEFSPMIKYQDESNSYPTSLAIAHFNQDDCLDIVTASAANNNIKIYIGDCNGTLKLFSNYNIDPDWTPTSIIVDDFNGDHYQDIALGYMGSTATRIYFGDGNGWFSASQMHPLGSDTEPSVVTSGDLNNDNRVDLVVALSGTNVIIGISSNENGSLTTMTTYLLQSCFYPSSILVADLNKDKQFDIILSCTRSDNFVVLFGNNDGKDWLEISYWIGQNSRPDLMASGDFNNDGQLDFATATHYNSRFGILMSDYEADFSIERKYFLSFGSEPISVVVGDCNGDHILDLVVLNSGKENVGVRLGFGDGSFGIERIYSTGRNSNPKSVSLYDVDRDDHLDILVANFQNSSVLILFGNGNGNFERTTTYSMDFHSNPISVVVADLDDDPWPDIIIANQGIGNIHLLHLYHYASFVLHQIYLNAPESLPRIVSAVDMNNDKQLDIVVINYSPRSVDVYFGDGKGNFTVERIYVMENGSNPTTMAVADLNNDGWGDLIISNSGTSQIDVVLADGNGHFEISFTLSIEPESQIRVMLVDDLNNDNRIDLIFGYNDRSMIEIFLGSGNGSLLFAARYFLGFDTAMYSTVLGDVNNDTYLDIVIAYDNNSTIGVLLGYGNGSFASQTNWYGERSGFVSLALGHLNNDNQLDIVVAHTNNQFISIYFGLGNESFPTATGHYVGADCFPIDLKIDDFNGDNRADIAVICAVESTITFLFGTEKGDFITGRKYFTMSGSVYKTIAFGDFNNDSYLDFAVANMEDGDIDIFLRNGTELLGNPTILSIGSDIEPSSIAVGDFDNDNRSDIVVTTDQADFFTIFYGTSQRTVWSNKSYSMIEKAKSRAVVVGHFDDDDYLDIAIVNSGTNEVMILQGHENRSFTTIRSYSTGTDSIPHSIAVGDFNNDRRLDLAVTNAGANTILILFGLGNCTFGNERSHSLGYNSRPYSIAVGDFNNDSWIDMAVANFEGDYVQILLQTC